MASAELHRARIRARHPTGGLTALEVDVSGTPLVGRHLRPGQYVQVGLEGHAPAPFALASFHSDGTQYEILVKTGSELADALSAMKVGEAIWLSEPEGRGFPLERGHGRSLLLFATGSGISAIRSVVQAVLRERSRFRDVTLYFGARTPQAFAYGEEHADWERSGIRVVRTVSRPGASGWVGLTGHVQHHLPEGPLTRSVAFLCGRPEMVEGVTAALKAQGMSADDIFLNF